MNVNDRIFTSPRFPLNTKLSNARRTDYSIVIETIPEYLARVLTYDRPLAEEVYIYSPSGEIALQDIVSGAMTLTHDKYWFKGGIEDVNFVPHNMDCYGEMYEYENTALTTIITQDTYHAVNHFLAGSLNRISFVAGIEGVGAITNYSATIPGTVKLANIAHGLSTGDIITVHASTSYNLVVAITKINNDNFYFAATYTTNQTADWAMGSYLLIGEKAAGTYLLNMSNSSYAAVPNSVFRFELNKNLTPMDHVASIRKYVNVDYGPISASGIEEFEAGDRIWLSTKNKTNAGDITVYDANINITKIA